MALFANFVTLASLQATEVKAELASYVARLPTACVDVTKWSKTLDNSPTLAQPTEATAKPLIYNDDKDDVSS
jgi:hypothetical protein